MQTSHHKLAPRLIPGWFFCLSLVNQKELSCLHRAQFPEHLAHGSNAAKWGQRFHEKLAARMLPSRAVMSPRTLPAGISAAAARRSHLCSKRPRHLEAFFDSESHRSEWAPACQQGQARLSVCPLQGHASDSSHDAICKAAVLQCCWDSSNGQEITPLSSSQHVPVALAEVVAVKIYLLLTFCLELPFCFKSAGCFQSCCSATPPSLLDQPACAGAKAWPLPELSPSAQPLFRDSLLPFMAVSWFPQWPCHALCLPGQSANVRAS